MAPPLSLYRLTFLPAGHSAATIARCGLIAAGGAKGNLRIDIAMEGYARARGLVSASQDYFDRQSLMSALARIVADQGCRKITTIAYVRFDGQG